MISTQEVGMLIALGVFLLLAGGLVLVAPVYHAWWRGYNPFVWAVACIPAMNPIFVLVVLASVPHRRRLKLRDQFTRDLDAKLAGLGGAGPGEPAADAAPIRTYSLGDLATELPHGRSVGDEPTRL
jgi:hypothetical protein